MVFDVFLLLYRCRHESSGIRRIIGWSSLFAQTKAEELPPCTVATLEALVLRRRWPAGLPPFFLHMQCGFPMDHVGYRYAHPSSDPSTQETKQNPDQSSHLQVCSLRFAMLDQLRSGLTFSLLRRSCPCSVVLSLVSCFASLGLQRLFWQHLQSVRPTDVRSSS